MFEDSFKDYLRMGRFKDNDEALARKLLAGDKRPKAPRRSDRAAPDPFAAFKRTAHEHRARMVSSGWSIGSGPEVLIKAGEQIKPREKVIKSLAYIARLDRKKDDPKQPLPVLHNEFGCRRHITDSQDTLKDWDLPPDEDNLSKTARKLAAKGRVDNVAALESGERLNNVQAWTFVLSILTDDMTTDAPRLERAASVTIARMFGSNGFRCLWALHTDNPGQPHVHLLVKAKPHFGNRLHSDKAGEFLQAFRVELAQNLRAAGYQCRATRREDRPKLRPAIARGEVPLRDSWSQQEAWNGRLDLQQRLPWWWSQHGETAAKRYAIARQALGNTPFRKKHQAAEVLERAFDEPKPNWLGHLFKEPLSAPPEAKTIPAGMRPLYREVLAGFRDPALAWISLCRIMLEGREEINGKPKLPNQSLALWYLRNRPWMFGTPKSLALSKSWQSRIRKATRGLVAENHVFTIIPKRKNAIPKPGAGELEKKIRRDRHHMVWSLERLARQDEELILNGDRPDRIRSKIIDVFIEPITGPLNQTIAPEPFGLEPSSARAQTLPCTSRKDGRYPAPQKTRNRDESREAPAKPQSPRKPPSRYER